MSHLFGEKVFNHPKIVKFSIVPIIKNDIKKAAISRT